MHIKENARLGHNLYCSKECQFDYRKTGKLLVCDNSICKEGFYRAKNDILRYNYCSQSCAATVNNQKYPKWPKKYCAICEKEFKNRDSEYCSSKCGWSATRRYRISKSKYSQKQIISKIKSFYKKYNRVPAKRETVELVSCATNKFDSWNNAIIAAGLTPNRSHDNRMYRRSRTKANDGHLRDSVSESIIDNWLHKNKIPHFRNAAYPNTNHLADWGINNNKIFIEYFGLAKDSPRYDRSIKEKQKLCRKHKIKLTEIYPKDLYPKNLLDQKLARLKIL